MRRLKVHIERKPPPTNRIWWKTFGAQQGFILGGLGLVILATGHWVFALVMLAVGAYALNEAWRRFG